VGIREGLERRVHGGMDSSELEEGGGGGWPAMGLGLAFYRPNAGRMSTGKV